MIDRKVIFERHYPSVDEELDEAALAEIDKRCETVKEMSSDDTGIYQDCQADSRNLRN